MRKAAKSVKLLLSLKCVILFSSCTTPLMIANHQNEYISKTLDFAPFNQARKTVEQHIRIPLKNRGEAHLTVINPLEWKVLKTKISKQEADQVATNLGLDKSEMHIQCIGKFEIQKPNPAATYYVVVKSPTALQVRQHLERLYKERGGKEIFYADHFFPHVTLGFTEKDLHEQDGAIKDQRSCFLPWNN